MTSILMYLFSSPLALLLLVVGHDGHDDDDVDNKWARAFDRQESRRNRYTENVCLTLSSCCCSAATSG